MKWLIDLAKMVSNLVEKPNLHTSIVIRYHKYFEWQTFSTFSASGMLKHSMAPKMDSQSWCWICLEIYLRISLHLPPYSPDRYWSETCLFYLQQQWRARLENPCRRSLHFRSHFEQNVKGEDFGAVGSMHSRKLWWSLKACTGTTTSWRP